MAQNVIELAICHVIKNGSLLLIKGEEGFGKDKWNAPSGEIVKGEQPQKAAMKHVFQQTGLYTTKVVNNGTIRLFLNGKNEYSHKLHVFSTKIFSGELKPNIKGEAKWFSNEEVPYYDMWADDKYWLGLVLQGKAFDADFFFDEKNEKITKYQLKERKQIDPSVLKAAIPIVIVALVVLAGVYGLKNFNFNNVVKPAPALVPSNSQNTAGTTIAATTKPTTSTTIHVTTTIPQVPRITIDNINVEYQYSGPFQQNGNNCNYQSHENVYGYKRIVNTTTFLMNLTWTSGDCDLTLTNMYTTTPGLNIVYTSPGLPVGLPASSQVYIEYRVEVTSPNISYIGPLSVVIDDQ